MARLIFGLIMALVASVNAVDIVKTKSAYKDIYVAIHEDIPENLVLIEKIKDLFTSASEFLFSATNRRAYYNSVTIVVPSSWTSATAAVVYSDYYAGAHVRIATPNPAYGEAPYTLQPGQCGEQGEYIHLTPKFLLNENGWSTEMFGNVDRQLVHEWAHFRYGVFDEHGIAGTAQFPLFYQMGGKIRPTNCIQGIKGWIEREDGEPCIVYRDGRIGDDCAFIPNLELDDSKSSIMYMPFLPKMQGFCQKDGSQKHNRYAPSMQNALCDFKSAAEVIERHKDFQGDKGIPDITVIDTKPDFRIVRKAGAGDTRTVLTMDVSNSMREGGRLEVLRKSAKSLISEIVPDQSSLAMVTFSTNAKIVANLTKVTNKQVRDKLTNLIPKGLGKTTSIGAGLRQSIQILTENNQSSEGCMIILISDGEENEDPKIEDVRNEVLLSKVIINSIAMGPDASEKLEGLTVATGGKIFYISDNRDASIMEAAFFESVTVQANVELQPVTILDSMVRLVKDKSDERKFGIEKELGKNTVISISSLKSLDSFQFEVWSPNGKYDKTSPQYSEDSDKIMFKFPTAESGIWKVRLTSFVDADVALKLTSEPLDPKEQPIRVKSWFGQVEVDAAANTFVKVFAQVSKGFKAVIRATVKVHIERPGADPVLLVLKDNGVGADILSDDGIYTATFNSFTQQGRYSTIVEVVSDGNARIKTGIPVSAAPMKPPTRKGDNKDPPKESFDMEEFRFINTTAPVVEDKSEPAGEFERTSNPGSFKLTGDVTLLKNNPDKITDLKATVVSKNDTSVTAHLMWTAPNAYDDGTETIVSKYEIRASTKVDAVISEDTDWLITIDDAAVTPLGKAPTIQTASMEVPLLENVSGSNIIDIYFFIRASDKTNQWAPMSNPASVHIGYVDGLTEYTTNAPTSTPEATSQEDTSIESSTSEFEFPSSTSTPEVTSQDDTSIEATTSEFEFSSSTTPEDSQEDTSIDSFTSEFEFSSSTSTPDDSQEDTSIEYITSEFGFSSSTSTPEVTSPEDTSIESSTEEDVVTTEINPESDDKANIGLIVGLSVGGGVLLIAVIVFIVVRSKSRAKPGCNKDARYA